MMGERKTTTIRIRMAAHGDVPSIAAVLHESFIEYKSSYTQEAFASTTPAGDQIQNRMKEGPIWVALKDDAIVGTVSAVPKGEALYIRGMAILPAARGQRVGLLLLREVESFASESGFKRLYLSTTPFLSRAIRLYEHYGFRHSSEGPHNLFGTPLFTMEKFLESSARGRDD
jgi:putative acetyltransferase